ncbi:MATE family efflux transporter [Seleniivibrio woodruffii]|uniref:MATE family efflux transporter n=1 Tax=Seleniivibrio woodruffii TaxID=1078050 RepID=UPI00240915D6|nr:MATE family efflux transporter [Seleniivibrio woodruffii]
MIRLNDRYRRVLAISMPAVFHNFMNIVQSMVDMLFVGRISSVSLASVGVSMQYTTMLYAFMSIVYVGTNVLVSRFYGSKEMDRAGQTVYMMFLFSFVISLPLMYFCVFHSPFLFEILGTDAEVVRDGAIYLSTYSYAMPALFIQGVLFSGLNAIGQTKVPFYISIFGNLINVVLDWVLIFGKFGFPEMGVQGAALATAITIYCQLAVYIWYYLTFSEIRIVSKWDLTLLIRGIRVAVPAWLERIVAHPSYIVLSALVAKFGVDALAGYQVGLRIEGLAFMPGVGFIFASMALVGQGIGAGKPDEAEKDATAAVISASVIMGVLGLLMAVFPHGLARMFTDNEATIENAVWYLRIMGISQVPLAVCFVVSGSLRGAGDTNVTFYINTVSLWGLRILPAWILTFYVTNSVWVYLVAMIESVVRAGILLVRFRSGKWKSIKV